MNSISWIFSGIGVALLALLLSPLRKPIISFMESVFRFIPFVERKQVETWASAEHFRVLPSPKSIINQVHKQPPAQRQFTEDQYKGFKVAWSLKFYTLFPEKDGYVRLMLRYGSYYPWAYCIVSLNDYPQLKIYREGRALWVAGTISSVHGHDITLDAVKLRLF